ncbi:JM75 [macacine gammaherpesvirus 11]|uniref:JM75 n=2 Tax=macacine gammaherpesvirus 11 TaxID=2560570 RepID=G9JM83_9GAMA|nr:JM75 [Macaca fuscata rhadinovirus]AAT00052.1 JM75 [Macaca fuscata rhadinovirus]AEW87600.1 JM75 [Macaca fuscata rhadinovirus]AEW87770.1 JM75 [Macaca fuscata rhadinovirus]
MAMFLSDPPRTPPATPRMLPIPGAPRKKRTRRFLFAGSRTGLPVPPGYGGPPVIDMTAPNDVFDADSPPTTPKTPDETDSHSENSNYSDMDEEDEQPVSSPPRIDPHARDGESFNQSDWRPTVITAAGPAAQPSAPAPLTAFGGQRPVAVVTGQHRAPPSSTSDSGDDFFIDDYEDTDESGEDADGFSPRASPAWSGDTSRSPAGGGWSSNEEEEPAVTGSAVEQETIIISDDDDTDDRGSVETWDESDADEGTGATDVIDLCSSSDSDDDADHVTSGGVRAACKRHASRRDCNGDDDVIYLGTTRAPKRRMTSTTGGGATSNPEGPGVSGRQTMAATPPVCGNDNYPWPWLD